MTVDFCMLSLPAFRRQSGKTDLLADDNHGQPERLRQAADDFQHFIHPIGILRGEGANGRFVIYIRKTGKNLGCAGHEKSRRAMSGIQHKIARAVVSAFFIFI